MGNLLKIKGFFPYLLMIFLNALVDLGHKIIIQNTVFKTYDGNEQIILTAIVNALILLPFILLFTPSAYLSDKYPKTCVMRASAWVAVVLTCFITLAYYQGWFWFGFAMTFLLAAQSAFYSPAKYGYIKQLAGKSGLATANGMVQAVTTVAILGGTLIFSLLFEFYLGSSLKISGDVGKNEILQFIAPIGWVLIGFTLIELMMAYRLPEKAPEIANIKFDGKAYIRGHYLKQNLRHVTKQQIIWLSIIGLSIFWALSQVVLAAFPAFAKEHLGLGNTAVIQAMLACSGIGIILGAVICGQVSKRYIETGIIPIGAIGVSICLILLPQLSGVIRHSINFFLLGLFGGFFIVPLNTLIQFHAGDKDMGKILAGNNWVQNIVMIVFLVATLLLAHIGLGSYSLFILLGLIAVLGSFYTLSKLPQAFARFVVARLISKRYRLSIQGFENFPERGGVLMLGNHISWIDWAILQIASPRPIRFVMLKSIYERWYLKWILKFFGVVPIASGASKNALKTITELLNNGEVVCLFPEGSISRNGQLGEFHKGYERAVANTDAVILPFYMHGLWGSQFSRSNSKHKKDRRYGLRRDVFVAFDQGVSNDITVEQLKQKVFHLSIRAWENYVQGLPAIATSWLRTAKRLGNQQAVVDTTGNSLSHHKMLVAVTAFSRRIAKISPEQNVALLLPTSSAGMVCNMACLLQAKTVVNLNYTANLQSLLMAVDKAEIQTVYTSSKFIDKLQNKGIDLSPLLQKLRVVYLEELKEKITKTEMLLRYVTVKALPVKLLEWLYCKSVAIGDPAAILFSSGSEGAPKGVVLSHKNLMGNVKQVADVLNAVDEEKIMASLPLFHAFGLTVTTFMPIVEGIPVVCHPDPTDVLNIAKAVAKHRVSVLFGTSTFLRLYNRNKRIHPLMLDSLRLVVAGAEKLNQDVRQAFNLKFKKEIYEGYGATETAPVASVNLPPMMDSQYLQVQEASREGTVGLPLPGTGFRIVDPQSLEDLSIEEDGLILIGGPQVMTGYLQDDEKTNEVLMEVDGVRWYKTGDKGHLDKDGFLSIIDRYSRFAKLGGEMISLTAVEDMVRQVLGKQELDLVAVNLPDSQKGEKIVLLLEDETDYQKFRQQLIADKVNPLMIPADIIHVTEVPKLGTGKTDFGLAKKVAVEHFAEKDA